MGKKIELASYVKFATSSYVSSPIDFKSGYDIPCDWATMYCGANLSNLKSD